MGRVPETVLSPFLQAAVCGGMRACRPTHSLYVIRRAGCPHPAAVPGCMDMKKNVQMVRHDNIRIHGDIVVNRFRAAN